MNIWHDRYDGHLSGSPDDALDRLVRRLLADVADLTIRELDAITTKAVEAAILQVIEAERSQSSSV